MEGARISITTSSGMRFEGTLTLVDQVNSTLSLEQVRSFGTEGRAPMGQMEVPPSETVFQSALFRGPEVVDLSVISPPAPAPSFQSGYYQYPDYMAQNASWQGQSPAFAPPSVEPHQDRQEPEFMIAPKPLQGVKNPPLKEKPALKEKPDLKEPALKEPKEPAVHVNAWQTPKTFALPAKPSNGQDGSRSQPRNDKPRNENANQPREPRNDNAPQSRTNENANQQRSDNGRQPRNDRVNQPRNDRNDKPKNDRQPRNDRPQGQRSQGDRPQGQRPQEDRPQGDRPQGQRPPRHEQNRNSQGQPRQDSRNQKIVVPDSEFDFETSNAKFEKEHLNESISMYSKGSFFDDISCEAKDREAFERTDRKVRQGEESRINLETFGQTGANFRRGRGRGRGGYRGNSRPAQSNSGN